MDDYSDMIGTLIPVTGSAEEQDTAQRNYTGERKIPPPEIAEVIEKQFLEKRFGDKKNTPGSRYNSTYSYAGLMRGIGTSALIMKQKLQHFDKKYNDPPKLNPGEIDEIVNNVMRYPPGLPDNPENALKRDAKLRTDIGNAARLFQQERGNVLYDHVLEEWIIWTPETGKWQVDITEEITQRYMKMVKGIAAEAEAEDDEKKQKELWSWWARSQTPARLHACLEYLRSYPEIRCTPDAFDQNDFLINLQDCTYDLKNHVTKPHDKNDRCMRALHFKYDPKADCPKWKAQLERNFRNRKDKAEIIDWYQRWYGYCLTGSHDEQSFHTYYGDGANGKSVQTGAIRQMEGDYGVDIDTNSLLKQQRSSQSASPDRLAMAGVRFVVAGETTKDALLDTQFIKNYTHGDPITARGVYGKHLYTYIPKGKLNWHFNHKPRVDDLSHGMWRGLLMIEFEEKITDAEKRDFSEIMAEFKAENPGIFNWCIEGLKKYQKDGLPKINAITKAVLGYRSSQDALAPFISECLTPGTEYENVLSQTLYDSYVGFSLRHGMRPMSMPKFVDAMKERGYKSKHTNKGTVWEKLQLIRTYKNPQEWSDEVAETTAKTETRDRNGNRILANNQTGLPLMDMVK